MKNFTLEEAGNTFQFITMNRRRIQLFQVYVNHENKKHRFHMQINDTTGDFHITDKTACPPNYHPSEKEFDYAIKNYGISEIIPT